MDKGKQKLLSKGTIKYPSPEEILQDFSQETKINLPNGKNVFGFWMQTLADLQLLDLELSGLTKNYKINAVDRNVDFENNNEFVRKRIAHLDLVDKKPTQYSYLIDLFGDTNAYGFHNLYPYKGKFYPRIVRTLINTFALKDGDIILDPYNGCGTTTHEASLLGIDSIGIDINPIGNIIADLKNNLIFMEEKHFNLKDNDLIKIFEFLSEKKRTHKNKKMYELFLMIYFDTMDAFSRTTRYNRKGRLGLFVEKFNYIKDCYLKTKKFLKDWDIKPKEAKIKEGNVLDLKSADIEDNSIDAIITSPPYYFSLDYVGKDKIAYDYLNEIGFFDNDMNKIRNKYIGMRIDGGLNFKTLLEKKIITYFKDLEKSIEEMFRALKQNGKIAIVIGDSTVNGQKLSTTEKTHEFALKYGLKHIRTVFNPLLGARNRAIRGESILIYKK